MTRVTTSLLLALLLISGCAQLSPTSRAYNDDLLNGIGALNGMPGDAGRALNGPGWQGVY